MMRRFILISMMFTGVLLTGASVTAQNKDAAAVTKAAENFVHAFNNFKWDAFRACFAADATIFFPEWDQVARVRGKEDIEKTWLQLFPEFLNNPDNYKLEISPQSVEIQLYGLTAVMTFHLGDGINKLARRTIVWRKNRKIWKIVHLHASVIKKEIKVLPKQ